MLRKSGKKLLIPIAAAVTFFAASPALFAAEAIPAGESYPKVLFTMGAMIAASFTMGIGALGVGLGMGTAINGGLEAVGRNPGAQGKILMTMLVGLAMAESIAIYCLVIALVLLYANPYVRYFLVG